MHIMDCHGVIALVQGGVLHYLLRKRALGANQAERLNAIDGERKAWYMAHPRMLRIPRIKAGNCISNGWAELHGPAFKAANTRGAVRFFKLLADKYCTDESIVDMNIKSLLTSLEKFNELLYTEPMFMSEAKVIELQKHTLDFGRHYQILRDEARKHKVLAWNHTPKVHRMQHFPMLAEIINPRHVSVYMEESMIGTTLKVYRRGMNGRYQASIQRTVLVKRMLGLFLRFEDSCGP